MSRLPPSFRKIRMELAREPGHPHGDSANGYEILVPIDGDGHIDAREWSVHPEVCVVRRFRSNTSDRRGVLSRSEDGEWLFDYDPDSEFDDEKGFNFSRERFVLGEYISILDEDEEPHVYKIVAINYP